MRITEIDFWAREYAETNPTFKNQKAADVLQKLFNQVRSMEQMTRRLTTPVSQKAAFVAILNELDRRWKLFAAKANELTGRTEVNPNGFQLAVRGALPEIYRAWKTIRAELQMAPLLP